jgi:hypothetical protein
LPKITDSQRGLSGNTSSAVTSYIALTGITDPNIVAAVNDFATGLINDGLWDKIDVMYPFIGGNVTAHSINLKNPGTYTITGSGWTGSVVHNNNGVSGTNNLNASFTVPYSHASQNPNDFSFGTLGRFPRSTSSSIGQMSLFSAGVTNMVMDIRVATGQTSFRLLGGTVISAPTAGFNPDGASRFIGISSNSASTAYSFINEFTQVSTISKGGTASGTSISAGLSTANFPAAVWTYSFWYTGKQLTETEMDNLNRRVQVLNQVLDTIQTSTRANNFYVDLAYNKQTNTFLSNIGIANIISNEASAINYLTTALIASPNNLWGNLTNIYPMVGINLATQLKELKNLGSVGGTAGNLTSSPLGLDPATNNSSLTPNNAITYTTPGTVGMYISEDFQSVGRDLDNNNTPQRISLNARNTSNAAVAIYGGTTLTVNGITNAKGHYTLAANGLNVIGNAISFYKNGVSIATGTVSSLQTGGTAYFFGGSYTGSSSMRSQAICYHTAGTMLNATQISELDTIIQTYVNLLGRQ